jgi:hypothetical protein
MKMLGNRRAASEEGQPSVINVARLLKLMLKAPESPPGFAHLALKPDQRRRQEEGESSSLSWTPLCPTGSANSISFSIGCPLP